VLFESLTVLFRALAPTLRACPTPQFDWEFVGRRERAELLFFGDPNGKDVKTVQLAALVSLAILSLLLKLTPSHKTAPHPVLPIVKFY